MKIINGSTADAAWESCQAGTRDTRRGKYAPARRRDGIGAMAQRPARSAGDAGGDCQKRALAGRPNKAAQVEWDRMTQYPDETGSNWIKPAGGWEWTVVGGERRRGEDCPVKPSQTQSNLRESGAAGSQVRDSQGSEQIKSCRLCGLRAPPERGRPNAVQSNRVKLSQTRKGALTEVWPKLFYH
jgi:hypothetical protein